jgi:hypothetical protein
MDFVVAVIVFFAALVGVLLWIGYRYPGTGAEQLDWKPTISYEDQIRLEMEEVDQMIEAQNERRRRTGRPELTEDEIRADVAAAERVRAEQASDARRSPGQDEGSAP